jgi:RsiW-degrading membrane proteinase PrsW (M82 family)
MEITPLTVLFALLGGILPAIIWLVFWLYEDSKRPEPRGLILKTFLLGMLAVFAVLPLQQAVERHFAETLIITWVLWALFEEAMKFGAAYFGGLISRDNDEPLDPMIYMITAALGFVALENALFINKALVDMGQAAGIITSNLRFIGSGLLHTVSSSIVGVTLALSFYKPLKERLIWGSLGLIGAVLVHTAFNLLLMHESNYGALIAFTGVWASIAILLLFFEKVKAIRMNKDERQS